MKKMDPNETLARIRELTTLAFEKEIGRAEAEELAELVMSLDTWISGGGFLPSDWSANSTPRLGYTAGGFR
jgi:hypothetical protein